jgi:siroheme synthase
VDWAAVARLKATVVVYMGLRVAGSIVARLRAEQVDDDLPIAVVSRATLPDQRIIYGTLGTFAAVTSGAALASPALLIIGEVIRQNPSAASALAALATVPSA